jgi:hypothetical protein
LGQVGGEGTAISSTPSDDVDMLDGQDQETVPGSGTHFFFLSVFQREGGKEKDGRRGKSMEVTQHHWDLLNVFSLPEIKYWNFTPPPFSHTTPFSPNTGGGAMFFYLVIIILNFQVLIKSMTHVSGHNMI